MRTHLSERVDDLANRFTHAQGGVQHPCAPASICLWPPCRSRKVPAWVGHNACGSGEGLIQVTSSVDQQSKFERGPQGKSDQRNNGSTHMRDRDALYIPLNCVLRCRSCLWHMLSPGWACAAGHAVPEWYSRCFRDLPPTKPPNTAVKSRDMAWTTI